MSAPTPEQEVERQAELAFEAWNKARGKWLRDRTGFSEFRQGFMKGLAYGIDLQDKARAEPGLS